MADLDERKSAVLRAVVAQYIDTAQPVGSGVIAKDDAIGVSSATIRNEMAALEQLGYLSQPYTSAGRVPTELGYRVFVDALGDTGVLAPTESAQVRDFFQAARGAIEDRLADTSELLSDLTAYTGVIIGPSHDPAVVKSVQLVLLEPGMALLVLVLSSGTVERHEVDLPTDVDDDLAARATNALSELLVGQGLGTEVAVRSTGDARLDVVVAAATQAASGGDTGAPVYVGSTSNMAAQFDAIDTVRGVLSILEQQLIVVSMVSDLLDRGLSVAIGSETGLPLAECSVVLAPLVVDGEQAGSVGVLGPTRMDYPKALAAVEVVSEQLGESIDTSS